MEQLFIVYCHLNKINSKRYIGKTCQPCEKRWRSGRGYPATTQPYFAAAIKKYGWDNFEHLILFTNLSAEEAEKKEIELIAYYHTYIKDPKCWGYNMTRGGDGSLKYVTEEEKLEAKKRWRPAHDKADKKYLDKIKSNPETYRKYLDKKALQKAIARQDVNVRNAERLRTKKCLEEVKQLRKQVIVLDLKFNYILSEEEKYNLKAANRCRSISYLTKLLEKFKEIKDGKDNETRKN